MDATVKPRTQPVAAVADKLVELDSLRGLLALWVYMSHVLFMTGVKGGVLGFLSHGGPAVVVFMILSGFAITTSLLNSKASYGAYAVRRIARIYPIYIVGLLLGMATSHLYPELLQATGFADPTAVSRIAKRVAEEQAHFLPHALAHLTMIHGAIPDSVLYGSALSFNGAAWSLSLEAQFYVFAPLLVVVLANPSRHLLSLGAIVAVILIGGELRRFWPVVPSFLPLTLGYFIVGILTAVHFKALRRNPNLMLAIALLALIACLTASRSAALPLAVWVGVLVVSSVPWPPFELARKLLSVKPLVVTGEISYGFYIIHMPILKLWGTWLYSHGFAEDRYVFFGMLLFSLPVTLVLAWLSYRFFEGPINKWAKNRFGGVKLRPVS